MISQSRVRFLALGGALAASLVASSAARAATIAAWTFENDGVAVNNSPAPSTGAGTLTSIGMDQFATPNVGVTTDDVVLGKSSDTGANTLANTTNTWRVRAQAGTNGAANGWSSLAGTASQGIVISASTVGATGPIAVTFDWYTTTQGEANLELAYSTTGTAGTFTNVALALGGSDSGLAVVTNNGTDTNSITGSYVSDNLLNNGSSAGQDWFTNLTATINDPAVANNPNFVVEIVNASTGADCVSTQGTALNNNSGNWRFDNINVSTAPVPEPASIGLLALGGLALLARAGGEGRRPGDLPDCFMPSRIRALARYALGRAAIIAAASAGIFLLALPARGAVFITEFRSDTGNNERFEFVEVTNIGSAVSSFPDDGSIHP